MLKRELTKNYGGNVAAEEAGVGSGRLALVETWSGEEAEEIEPLRIACCRLFLGKNRVSASGLRIVR